MTLGKGKMKRREKNKDKIGRNAEGGTTSLIGEAMKDEE